LAAAFSAYTAVPVSGAAREIPLQDRLSMLSIFLFYCLLAPPRHTIQFDARLPWRRALGVLEMLSYPRDRHV